MSPRNDSRKTAISEKVANEIKSAVVANSNALTRLDKAVSTLSEAASAKFSLLSGSQGFMGGLLLAVLASFVGWYFNQSGQLVASGVKYTQMEISRDNEKRLKETAEEKLSAKTILYDALNEWKPIAEKYGTDFRSLRFIDMTRDVNTTKTFLGKCDDKPCLGFWAKTVHRHGAKNWIQIDTAFTELKANGRSGEGDPIFLKVKSDCHVELLSALGRHLMYIERDAQTNTVLGMAHYDEEPDPRTSETPLIVKYGHDKGCVEYSKRVPAAVEDLTL